MLDLIVEDGSGIANSNSYVSLEYGTSFLSLRGYTVENLDIRLMAAMDILNRIQYKGTKTYTGAVLSFPRSGVKDLEGEYYSREIVPREVKEAQVWLAYYTSLGNDLGKVSTPAVKSQTLDVLQKVFAVRDGDKQSTELKDLPNAFLLMRHLMVTKKGRVIRA